MKGETGGRSRRTPTCGREKNQSERHKAREGEEETEAEEDKKGSVAEGDRNGDTPRGEPEGINRVGGNMPPPEENADIQGFTPECAHLLLQGVYGDFPYHNDGSQLGEGIADDSAWQRRWRWLAAQSISWYATPSEAVGRRFTAILAAE